MTKGQTPAPATPDTQVADAARARDAAIRAADKELELAMTAVHVARAKRDTVAAEAARAFDEAVAAATTPQVDGSA
jgi:hypothetical protein